MWPASVQWTRSGERRIGGDGCPDARVAIAQYSGPMRIAVGSGKSPVMTGFVYGGGSGAGIVYDPSARARTLPTATIKSTSASTRARLAVTGLCLRGGTTKVFDTQPGPPAEVPPYEASVVNLAQCRV